MRKLAVAFALLTLPLAQSSAQSVLLSGAGTISGPVALLPGFVAGSVSFSFTLPSSPVPTSATAQSFQLGGVTGVFSQGALPSINLTGVFEAFIGASGGGFVFNSLVNALSPQIFTGATATPTFAPGDYTTTNNSSSLVVSRFTIANVTTTPEPSTYALMGVGLVAVGVLHRRRKTSVSV